MFVCQTFGHFTSPQGKSIVRHYRYFFTISQQKPGKCNFLERRFYRQCSKADDKYPVEIWEERFQNGDRHSVIMKMHVPIAVMFCFLCNLAPVRADQATNDIQIKSIIVSIQKEIVDLTDPVEPLYDAQFVATRKAMTEGTARQIVKLIHQGDLTTTQAEIGVLLLSSLKQQTYWVVTEPLLTTNTEEEVLDTVVSPPFPFGPGYANTYKIEYFKERLLQLKTQRPDDNLDLILSGEDSRGYSDYLKHPHAYGY